MFPTFNFDLKGIIIVSEAGCITWGDLQKIYDVKIPTVEISVKLENLLISPYIQTIRNRAWTLFSKIANWLQRWNNGNSNYVFSQQADSESLELHSPVTRHDNGRYLQCRVSLHSDKPITKRSCRTTFFPVSLYKWWPIYY